MTSRVDAAAAAAARRAQEAARRAAEAKRQAEAAQQAAAAKAAAAAAKKTSAAKSPTAKTLKRDEFSTGRAKALRLDELKGSIPRLKIEGAAKPSAAKRAREAEEVKTSVFALSERSKLQGARDVGDSFLDKVGRGITTLGDLFGGGRTEATTAPSNLSQKEQAELDAAEINELAESDPREAADELKDRLEANTDPEYRAELIRETEGAVEEIARTLSQSPPDDADVQNTIEDLAEAAALAGTEGAQELGEAFARGLEGGIGGFEDFGDISLPQSALAASFQRAILETPGAGAMAVGMLKQARESGNDDLVGELTELTESTATMALDAFEDARNEVDQLNGELARLVQGFGADADPADLQEAIENFKESHEEQYAAFEAAGAAMSNVIDLAPSVLEGSDDFGLTTRLIGVLAQAPRVAETAAGQEALGRALEAQANGEPSFLDSLGSIAENIDDGADFLGKMADLVTQGVAARATQLVADGRLDDANKLIDGLSDNAQLFGVDPEDLEGIEQAFKDTLAGKPGAVEDLNKQLSEGIDGGPPLLDPNGRAAQALKGLGLALGVAGLPGQFENLDEAQLEEQIKLIAETLDLSQEAGSLALQVFGKTESLASLDKLFGKVGLGAGAVIAVADTVSALRSLSEGEFGDAAVSGLSAASGVLLLIPGAQVAGVGLALASFALNSVLADRRQEEAENASEGDALQFLKDRGLEDDFANVFANLNNNKQNIGAFVDQVAEQLGLTQDELFEKLNDASGEDREELLKTFGGISAAAEVLGEFGEGGKIPVFGPPATAEDFEGIDFLSDDERQQIADGINARREEIAGQVADQIEPFLD